MIRRLAVMSSLILVCSAALPLIVRADEATFVLNDSQLQAYTIDQSATIIDYQVQNKLLRQLIAQKVMYHLDDRSTLNFSCNLAARSGKVELVVRF
jgi:hypothetical protein